MKVEDRDSSTVTRAGAEAAAQGGRQSWRQVWRGAGRQLGYLGLTLAALALGALALGALAAGLQAGRDEARSADLALVVAPAVPPASLADQVFELYRRGYVPRVVMVGEGQAGLVAQLVERGVPESSLEVAPEAGGAAFELRQEARAAYASGAASALVVAPPVETLRALKVVRDQGLRAYGAPPPDGVGDPLSLAAASAGYWRYVLLGR
jgi:hypothetical protein